MLFLSESLYEGKFPRFPSLVISHKRKRQQKPSFTSRMKIVCVTPKQTSNAKYLQENMTQTYSVLTGSKQTARYFSSNDGFIQDLQRIAIWSLQPRWAMCEFPHGGERRVRLQGDKERGRAVVNREPVALHCLSPCWERGVFLFPDAQLSLEGVRAPSSGPLTPLN